MSTESDNNHNDMSSGVGEGDITDEVHSDEALNVAMVTRSDSEESYSGLDRDSQKILDKFNYYADVQEICADWLKTLETNEASGTALLLASLVGSAGCPSVFLNEKDFLNVTSVEKFEKAMRDATLSKRKFELNRILEFIRHTFHKEILLRKFLMKEFVSFVLLMSGSHFKSFRMVAVHVGTTVMSLLLKLEAELKLRFERLERTLKDTTLTAADVRLYEVEKEKLCRITDHFNVLFDKLCHVCHRDVEVDIRLRVITILIIWLKDYPQKFLNDNYLRYFVWMLTDPSGKVRFRAIKACIDLFKDESNRSKLQMFVVKSKPLIVKMINDVSLVIAEAALLCLHCVYRNYNVLTKEEYEQIYCNVYSVKAKIAEAAGSFVLQKITIGAQSDMAMLKDLARFHYESGVKENEEYFVSALINKAPFLMNWKLWTKTILFTTNASILPVLCRMLISVIKLISNNEQYIQKKMKMVSLTSQEKYMILRKRFHADEFHESNLQKMTSHFALMLPQLIQTFYVNEKCLIPLVQIPQYFDFNYNVDMRHIVDLLHQVFMTSTNILKDTHCCFSLITILDNSQHGEVISRCRKLVNLFSEKHFKNAVITILENKLDLRNEEQVQSIQLIIQKTVTLVTFHNLCSTSVWPLALQGLQQAASNIKEPASDDLSCILKLLSSICYKNIYWRVDEMFNTVENNGSVHDADMKKLSEYTSVYHELLTVLLKKTSCTEVVETAFIAVCHILLTFSKNNKKLNKLKRLVILPSTKCLELLSHVLEALVPCSDVNQSSIKLYRQQSFLKKYCYLLQSNTIRIQYLSNVLPYLKNEGFKEVVGETLCTLFRKDSVETSRVIIIFMSYWFNTSQEEGSADAVHLAEIIASTVSARIKRKNEIAFRLHIAAIRFVRTYNCIDFLKVVVGFAKLLSRNMIPRLEQLIELFFGHTVPIDVHDYLDSVHQAVGIAD